MPGHLEGIRLRIFEAIAPNASKHDIVTDGIIKKCKEIEDYVLGVGIYGKHDLKSSLCEESPDSHVKRSPGRPRKRQPAGDD